ncbi:MAG: RNA polymerase-associated protein RapA [Marinobacter sp.]|nr:RNA polymerase-associated protein RapA [Marinobacter sp.]
MESSGFVVGQRWVSHSDTALGLGIVTEVSGRRVTLGFPAADEERTYATDNAPLSRVRYQSGEQIETFDGQVFEVRDVQEHEGVLLYEVEDAEGNRHSVSEVRLSSHVHFSAPQQRLFAGQFDRNGAFRLRMATWQHLDRLRASSAQGLIGARTSHLPHQLYIAQEVARRFAPRVLLADEVGLGKTIEAGLILHYQLHTERAKRVLIVVPDSLIHQWLVEMLRRFNLSFSIVDQGRYDDLKAQEDEVDALVNHIFGDDSSVNPFESAQLVLCSLDFLVSNEQAHKDALAAGWDLLVVDEAHHLGWTPEQASPAYQAIESLAEHTRGLLLLTATPEQLGVAGHFARLRLLDPARFHDLAQFQQDEARYAELNTVMQQLLATEGLPDTGQQAILQAWLGDELTSLLAGSEPVRAIVDALLDRHGTGRVLFRNTRAAIQGFPERQLLPVALECPQLYHTSEALVGLEGLTPETSVMPDRWLAEDPRVSWLEKTLISLRPAKVVVICAHAETAVVLEEYLQLRAGIRSAAFHEGLSLLERDRAAAYFAETEQGAQALICSEIGSEGRNFQFAHHLVLFDLPANPDLLEQRIGRLDRIGQQQPVKIHVPYLQGTAQDVQFRWFHEGLRAFTESCAVGVVVQATVQAQWQHALDEPGSDVMALISATATAADSLRAALQAGRDALIELNSCRPREAAALIENIEAEEDAAAVRDYIVEACDIYGVELDEHSAAADILRPTDEMLTGHFPGLPSDGITVTFDRQLALSREDMAFLSWEHPMVTGVMDMVTSSDLGKAALASLSVKGLPPGTLLLEALFRVHCAAPADLQLSRALPVAPTRFLLDAKGKDLSAAISHERLNELCSNIRRRTAQAIVPQVRDSVETMVTQAQALADQRQADVRQQALQQVRRALQPEIDRLLALQARNPAVRDDEIAFFTRQLAACEQAIERATLSLEAIRVIITA